jgi:hypothetical protein
MRNGTEVSEAYCDDGSPVAWWKTTVGGQCSIPAEGLERNGTRVYCDPQPRKPRVENPSCANCFYLDYMGEKWQFDFLTVNDHAALSPYEREQAIATSTEDVTPAQAVGLALWRKQSNPAGRRMFYRANLIKSGLHDGVQKYRVKFADSGVTAVICEGDSRWTVYGAPADFEAGENSPPVSVAVEVAWPHHRVFRLPLVQRHYPLIWPSLPKKVAVNPSWQADLADPNCPRCRPSTSFVTARNGWRVVIRPAVPCYYHSRGPRKNIATGEIEFHNFNSYSEMKKFPNHGCMRVVERNGQVLAVDWNGNLPTAYSDEVANASVFRLWLPELVRQARLLGAEHQIMAQYYAVTKGLRRSRKGRSIRPSWLANSGQEPSKPTCSHPLGLNLRKVMNDSFGQERTDMNFDLGAANQMEIEEELRVGYRQHSQTPQRLQEEIMSTIATHPGYDTASGDIRSPEVEWPVEWTVHQIAGIGGMKREDGSAVTDVNEFMDRLDDEVVIGTHGDVDRKISRRKQLFGYDMTRGYYGKRRGSDKTAMPAGDPEMVMFETTEEPDQVDISDAWVCVECSSVYDHCEIEDFYNPVCDCGADLYRNHASRDTLYTRSSGGVGVAIVKDTPSMMQRQRLYECVCPQWRLNTNSSVITLEDVWGASQVESPQDTGEAVVTVRVPVLTDEHKRINAEYARAMEAVLAQREAHHDKYPDTTPDELAQLFPTPRGTCYEQIIQGSVAKMGSVTVLEDA